MFITFASLLGSCTMETCFPSCFWLRIDWCPILAWRAWNQITWLMVDLFKIHFLMFAEIWRLMRMYEAWLSWQRFFLLIAAMVLEMAKLVQLNDFWRGCRCFCWGLREGNVVGFLSGCRRHIEGKVVHHRLWFDFFLLSVTLHVYSITL